MANLVFIRCCSQLLQLLVTRVNLQPLVTPLDCLCKFTQLYAALSTCRAKRELTHHLSYVLLEKCNIIHLGTVVFFLEHIAMFYPVISTL